jgi:hypothetical protein
VISEEGATAELIRLGTEYKEVLAGGEMPETIKQRIEREVKERFEEFQKNLKNTLYTNPARPCAYCDGVYRETPTFGRLECPACGSVCLVGRAKPIVHVEGADAGKGR